MQLIFVYGSLKRGHCLHRLLADQKFLGPAVTQPGYLLFDCGSYPGLCDSPTGHPVHGELYDVDESRLTALDAAEGVPEHLYARRTVHLQPPHDIMSVQAWFFLQDTSAMNECGDRWPAATRPPVENP
jgi:gamma-glutamylaminecyclotransferase